MVIFGDFGGKLMRRDFIWAAIDGRDEDTDERRPNLAATGTRMKDGQKRPRRERCGRDGIAPYRTWGERAKRKRRPFSAASYGGGLESELLGGRGFRGVGLGGGFCRGLGGLL